MVLGEDVPHPAFRSRSGGFWNLPPVARLSGRRSRMSPPRPERTPYTPARTRSRRRPPRWAPLLVVAGAAVLVAILASSGGGGGKGPTRNARVSGKAGAAKPQAPARPPALRARAIGSLSAPEQDAAAGAVGGDLV